MSFTINKFSTGENISYYDGILEDLDEVFSIEYQRYEVTRQQESVPAIGILPMTSLASITNSAIRDNYVSEDSESIKRRFGWKTIDGCNFPFIIRVINGEYLHYSPQRIVEIQSSRYLNYLHPKYVQCITLKNYPISFSEANLFNEINNEHSDNVYGKKPFQAYEDYVIHVDDIQEYYKFLNVCYRKLMNSTFCGNNEKCGLLQFNNGCIVPYCIIDEQKYVPLLFFDSTEHLLDNSVKIENWNLAYIKFCCIVQDIRNDILTKSFCLGIRLDIIQNFFPLNTNFEEYWPIMENGTQLRTNWEDNVSSPSLTAPSMLPNMPSSYTYKKEWPIQIVNQNEMVNSVNTETQLLGSHDYLSATRNMDSASQYYISNSDPAIFKPPLINENLLTLAVNYPNTEYNIEPISQPLITYDSMTNESVMSHSNQIGQINQFTQQEYYHPNHQQLNNNEHQQHYNHYHCHEQQRYNGDESIILNGFNTPVTKTHLLENHNALPTSIVDLTISPPTSPILQSIIHTNAASWVLKKIPETHYYVPNSPAYKISLASLNGIKIYCINAVPYEYDDLMMTLDQLVEIISLPYTIEKCANVLYNYLKITLFRANSKQIAILSKYRGRTSLLADDTPMAMLKDVNRVFQQLNCFMMTNDKQIEEHVASKRRRIH